MPSTMPKDNPLVVQKQDCTSPFTLYERFDWLALSVPVSASLCILGPLGFLWFLWRADASNSTWRSIAIDNWLTRAISLSSLIIRNSMTMQAGNATSMLLIEKNEVLLLCAASVSMMRNATFGLHTLAWCTASRGPPFAPSQYTNTPCATRLHHNLVAVHFNGTSFRIRPCHDSRLQWLDFLNN